MGWKATADEALKMLGKGGQLPKPPVDIGSLSAPLWKASTEFDAASEGLEKKILEYESRLTQAKLIFQQYADVMHGSDFDLDPKKPEDKKRIDAACKFLITWLKTTQAKFDSQVERLAKLNSVVADIKRLDAVKF